MEGTEIMTERRKTLCETEKGSVWKITNAPPRNTHIIIIKHQPSVIHFLRDVSLQIFIENIFIETYHYCSIEVLVTKEDFFMEEVF